MNNETVKITKIYEPIEITDEMRKIANEMQEAISTEYKRRVLEDEKKLEAVLIANGWRKVSEVAREIFEEIERVINYALCVDVTEWEAFAELKKKYTEGEG